MVEASFGGGDDVADLARADAALLGLDQRQLQCLALALIRSRM
jgi:hypothetical protein